MRRIKMVLAVAAAMAMMLVAFVAPAMADTNDKDDNDRNDLVRSSDSDWNDHNDWNDFGFDNDGFFFSDFDRFDHFNFDNGFGNVSEQEADSGDVDQSFEVSGTGDNSNQCVGIQGVANSGNAQNQVSVTQFGQEGDFDDFERDGFFFDNDRFDRFDREAGDVEFEDAGSTIEVSPEALSTCDQQVNQAATASDK